MIFLEKCDKKVRKTCKSDDEVKEWLKDKYVMLGYNQQQFNSEKFKEKTFTKKILLDWMPINIHDSLLRTFRL